MRRAGCYYGGMPPSSPLPAHTSRFDALRLEPDGASFILDGRPVRLDSEHHGPTLEVLRAFHGDALADYRARVARPGRSPGSGNFFAVLGGVIDRVFARVRNWIGGSPAPERAVAAPATPPPLPASPSASASEGPILQTVFADRDGVHLVWRAAGDGEKRGAKAPGRELTVTYDLDSAMAGRLQDCYDQLGKLGYKVVGLELVRPAPSKSPDPTPHAPVPEAKVRRVRAAPPAPASAEAPRPEGEPGVLPGL